MVVTGAVSFDMQARSIGRLLNVVRHCLRSLKKFFLLWMVCCARSTKARVESWVGNLRTMQCPVLCLSMALSVLQNLLDVVCIVVVVNVGGANGNKRAVVAFLFQTREKFQARGFGTRRPSVVDSCCYFGVR